MKEVFIIFCDIYVHIYSRVIEFIVIFYCLLLYIMVYYNKKMREYIKIYAFCKIIFLVRHYESLNI